MDNEITHQAQESSTMESEMEATNEENNDNIILPDSTELDWAQILYAFNYKRLMFINDYRIWSDFYTINLEYNDYDPEELSYRFLQRVLPNIFQYELNDQELHLLNLLDLHPDFQRTEKGFNEIETMENVTFPVKETVRETILQRDSSLQELNFIANKQIVVREFGEQCFDLSKFHFNKENAALLSVVLSSDDDLPNCELLTVEEISKRFKTAKRRFEINGEQLENVNLSINDLLKKLETLKELKVVIQLVNKTFLK